jgi:hypothetical protein
MTDEEYRAVVITPQAWNELYALLKPLLTGLGEWGTKHDVPVSVAVGVMWGASQIVADMGNFCDCPLCSSVADAVADELFDRMIEPISAVKH